MESNEMAPAAWEADEGTQETSGAAQDQYNVTDENLHSLTPDLSEAKRLLNEGMTLVKLHDYQKRPVGLDWNNNAATRIDPNATGYGLPLAANGLCSIDPDHMEMARVAVKAWGYDLDELLNAGVRTGSTRPGSGGRSAFEADPEEVARWIPFRVFDDEGNGITVLELRAKSPNLQDCVPGVVYCNADGDAYTQQYQNEHRFDEAPALPDNFARLWRLMSLDDDSLREYDRIAFEAIRGAGFKVHGKKPKHYPQMGNGDKLPFEADGYRGQYNRDHSVEDVIERHGYSYHARLKRWSHPGATGAPAIRPIPGKDGLWRSDHAGDRLHGAFDAWAAHVVLDHDGDVEAAKAAMDEAVKDEFTEDESEVCLAARRIGYRISKELKELTGEEWPVDNVVIHNMVNGAFWSGSKGKLFILNEDEALLQFPATEGWKFLCRRFGHPVDTAAINDWLQEQVNAEELNKGDAKEIAKQVKAAPVGAVVDYIKYQNQRDAVEWRVDMFAPQPRLELKEDMVRLVLTHKPYPDQGDPDPMIVDDFKQHFPELDEVLRFVVASRFAADRKKSYLWVLATSDWGKGFMLSIFKDLNAAVELSVKEIESMFEGKPVGRRPEDFKRALILAVDEFKSVKSELKQLQSEMSLAPKHALTSSVEIFAKLFLSAESVESLVTDHGVEDQFANRMNLIHGKGEITERFLYSLDSTGYFRQIRAYVARELNRLIDEYRQRGREQSERKAADDLDQFMADHGIDRYYQRFSASLEDVAAEAARYFAWDLSLTERHGDYLYLKSAAKRLEDYLSDHYTPSQVGSFKRRKPEIMRMMSDDGRGNASHTVAGGSIKAVRLGISGQK